MFYRINWDATTHSVLLETGTDSAPAAIGGTGMSDLGTFEHDNESEESTGINGMQGLADNHVIYHHVQDVLYKQGVQDMQSVKILINSPLSIPIVTAGTLLNPPFGMILNWPSAYEASHSPFINVLKTATEWRSSPQSGQTEMNWDALVAGGNISPTGTINSIPVGQDNLVMDALGYMDASSGASGRYRLFYSCRVPDAGNNIWIMGGVSNIDNSVPGQIDFDFTANGSSSVTIMMVGVPSDGEGAAPITLTAMVKHDHLDLHAAGEVFDPAWLDVIRNNRVLRFGDWQRVDRYRADPNDASVQSHWADRTQVDRITYDGAPGVPFEHMFSLCNLVGADAWINILSAATDDYCTQLAALALQMLGPNRRLYTELSNKAWDAANYVTADYFRYLADLWFSDTSMESCMEAYGGRSAEVFAIFQSAWTGANAGRLRTVLQGWTGVAHQDSYILDAPRWVAAQAGRVAPWTLATDFALQNVLDGGLRYDWMTENLAVLDGWFADLASAAMTEQDLIEEFASALRGTNPAVSGGYDIASLGANYDEHLTYLATRPLNVIAYEGGSHLCVPPARNGNAVWRDFYRTFHRSPEGAAAFGDARAAFLAKFPAAETVYVYRCDVRKPDQNQSEGLYFYLGDTTGNNPLTRWLADQAARTGATGRGDGAFVGTMEQEDSA